MKEMASQTCAWDFATQVRVQGPFDSLTEAVASGLLPAAGTYAADARISKESAGKATVYIYSAIDDILQPSVLQQGRYKPENIHDPHW